MAGRHSTVNSVANDENSAKTNMIDLWKQSMERVQKERTSPTKTAQSSTENRVDLEERIRNGQEECPTCSARTYQDQSNDGGVSFQSARHISAATAGVVVMNHEHEHVSAGKAEEAQDGAMRQSTVALEYGKCPDCGKTYVKGGVTKTTTRPASYNKQSGLDMQI